MTELNSEQIKPMLVEILSFLHQYCVEHNLNYYLTGGTLLGAIRHHGFIPWDDDIDINMLRSDYEKLLDSFEDPSGRYKIISLRNDDYYLASAKIIDTTTIMKENCDVSLEIGLYIDIFPMDNLSDDYAEAKRMFKSIRKYRDAVIIKNLVSSKRRSAKKNAIIRLGKIALLPFSRKLLLKKIDQEARKHEQPQMTAYIGTVATAIYGEKEILRREWFQSKCEVEFENRLFYVPVGYDALLSQLYGDYMQLPPVEKRKTHHDNRVWLK